MTRPILILAAIVIGATILAAFLSGCQSYQPPGEGIWRAL
jgi:multisubunit Na+/H+ antiporter MnhC subunit